MEVLLVITKDLSCVTISFKLPNYPQISALKLLYGKIPLLLQFNVLELILSYSSTGDGRQTRGNAPYVRVRYQPLP